MSEDSSYHSDSGSAPSPERRRVGLRGPLMGGIIVIGVGIVFLLQNLGVLWFDNWWALFIFIPAAGSFGSAWEAYRVQGRFSRAVSGPLTTGCLFVFLALIFLFNWPWSAVWPVFIILIGLGVLLGWRSS